MGERNTETDYKLLCMDADGTLYDSRSHFPRVLVTALHDLGVRVTSQQAHDAIGEGLGLKVAYKKLAPNLDPHEVEERFYYFDSLASYEFINPYKGVIGMLHDLKNTGVELAITSNRSHESVVKILAHLGMIGMTNINEEMIFTPSVEIKPKPAPDQIIAAAGKCGLALSQVAVIGDTVGDIKAGQAAGVGLTLGFTKGFGSSESLLAAGADIVIDKMKMVAPALVVSNT